MDWKLKTTKVVLHIYLGSTELDQKLEWAGNLSGTSQVNMCFACIAGAQPAGGMHWDDSCNLSSSFLSVHVCADHCLFLDLTLSNDLALHSSPFTLKPKERY